jgi:hypothetical protein
LILSSSGGKYGVPPPRTTGLMNSRYSSMRPSFMKLEARPAPPTARFFPVCSFSLATSSAAPSLTSLALPSTFSSVLENTIFGIAFQMRANSSTYSGADGSWSAVSQ